MSTAALRQRAALGGFLFELPSWSVEDLPLLNSSREIRRCRNSYKSHFPIRDWFELVQKSEQLLFCKLTRRRRKISTKGAAGWGEGD